MSEYAMVKNTQARLLPILEQLKQDNPHLADKFCLDRHGCAIGLKQGDFVLMVYSRAIGTDGVVECRYDDGSFPAIPAKDW